MTEARDVSTADRLIADLTGAAGTAEAGEWGLSGAEAARKLAAYRLPRPELALVLLVRSAVARGAGFVDVAMGMEETVIAFDGSPFTRDELVDRYAAALSSRDDARTRSLRQLTIALQALPALGVTRAELLSGVEPDGCRLLFEPPSRPVVTAAGSLADLPRRAVTRIRLEAFVPDLDLDLRFVRAANPRVVALAEGFRPADLPVTVNGRRVSAGLGLPEGYRQIATITAGASGVIGEAEGLAGSLEDPWLELVKDGCVIARHLLPVSRRGVLAVVRADGLALDLSQADVVRGPEYAALVEAVRALL